VTLPISSQTALVVGAGSGIGRAIALGLAGAGARVALVGRNRANLEATKAAMKPDARPAVVASCDATDRAQVAATIAMLLAELGSIDILVYTAGLNVPKRSLRSLDPTDWDRLVSTNLTGAFNLVHFTLPGMRERGSGLVIQISSISAKRPSTISGAAYSASKAAQAVLGVCIGREERGRGIRSTVIYSGEVNTPLLDARATRPGGVESSRREAILQPEDIAAAVCFMAGLPPRAHIPEFVIKPTIDDFS
jgi:NADP-dependent 3-hydroxy acid dehydrogenase YdfG